MGSNTTTGGGIGVFGLLGVVFVTLKLVGVIDWSWWWVTLPFWGPIALALTVFFGLMGLVVLGLRKGTRVKKQEVDLQGAVTVIEALEEEGRVSIKSTS